MDKDKAIRSAKLTAAGILDKARARTAVTRAGGQIAPSKYLPNVPRQVHAGGGKVAQSHAFMQHLRQATEDMGHGFGFEEGGCLGMAHALAEEIGGNIAASKSGFNHYYAEKNGNLYDYTGQTSDKHGYEKSSIQEGMKRLGVTPQEHEADKASAKAVIEEAKSRSQGYAGGGKVAFQEGNHPDVPDVVYHGTTSDVKSFDRSKINMGSLGFHFGSKGAAGSFADTKPDGSVMPVHLSLKNPIRLQDHGNWDIGSIYGALSNSKKFKQEDLDDLLDKHFCGDLKDTDLADFIRANGYDGVVYLNRYEGITKENYDKTNDHLHEMSDAEFKEAAPEASDSFIAFHPTQIKSAIGNQGTFDPNDPDITKAGGGNVEGDNGHIYVVHGGSDFDQIDPSYSGRGEPGNIRPLGKGLYGYVLDHADPENFDNAIGWATRYSQKYGGGKKALHVYKIPKSSSTVFNGQREINTEGYPKPIKGLGLEPQEKMAAYMAHRATEPPHTDPAWWDWSRKGSALYKDFKDAADLRMEHLPIGLTEIAIQNPKVATRIGKFSLDTPTSDILDAVKGDVQGRATGGRIHAEGGGKMELRSRAAEVISGLKGEKGLAEDMIRAAKNAGVKDVEIANASPPSGKISRDELARHFENAVPKVQVKRIGDAEKVAELKKQHSVQRDIQGMTDDEIDSMLDHALGVHEPLYEQYQLPYGKNYREHILSLPDDRGEKSFHSTHWDSPNVLAHVRLSDRYKGETQKNIEPIIEKLAQYFETSLDYLGPSSADHAVKKGVISPDEAATISRFMRWENGYETQKGVGRKILHVEELQSDWNNTARKEGLKTGREKQEYDDYVAGMRQKMIDKVTRPQAPVFDPETGEDRPPIPQDVIDKKVEKYQKMHPSDLAATLGVSAEHRQMDLARYKGVYPAPYIDPDSRDVENLALKHVLTEAAKGGYDGITFTPGSEQSARWGGTDFGDIYDRILPNMTTKLARQHDKTITPNVVGLPSARGNTVSAQLIPLTETARQSILKNGFSAFKRGGTVGKEEGGALGEDDGITAYHSSPHDFDQFDISKLGTGEGNQSYGPGLYFAENPKVSDRGGQYWNQFMNRGRMTPEKKAAFALNMAGWDRDKAVDRLQKNFEFHTDRAIPGKYGNGPVDEEGNRLLAQETQEAIDHVRSGKILGPRTYKVKLNVKPHELIDWDEPLSEQHPNIQAVLGSSHETAGSKLSRVNRNPNYRGDILGKDTATLQELYDHFRSKGIKGIRYNDAGSRHGPNGDGTKNYVMFHHDPVQVVDKYEYGGTVGKEEGGATGSLREKGLWPSAQAIKAGTGSREAHEALVNKIKPVSPYAAPVAPASDQQVHDALTKDKQPKAFAPRALEEGTPVAVRLDIPAYEKRNTWVVSVHHPKSDFTAGEVIGYDSVAHIGNPRFGVHPTGALNIASGKPKSTIATVHGNWKKTTPEDAFKLSQTVHNDPQWRQVGMDPERHSYFYDRETQEPVMAADEALHIGPLVYAKNPVYGKKTDFAFSSGGDVSAALALTRRFTKDGTGATMALKPKGK